MSGARRPLRVVLLSAMAGVALGAVVLTGALTIGMVNLTAERTALEELARDADFAARRIARAGPRASALPPCRVLPVLGISEVCVALADRPPPHVGRLSAPEGRTTIDGEDVLYTTRPVTVAGTDGTLWAFRPASSVARPGRALTGRVIVAGLVALGLSAGVAYALSSRISRPLAELAGAARGLAAWGRGVTWAGASPGEPAEVAAVRDALREVSGDLERARRRERTFLMSVSHELRTPLTAIRGYGEALVDGTARTAERAGEVIVGESRRLERLVQDLLDLARLEAGEFSVVSEETDLGTVAAAVVESMRPRAKDAGVRLELDEHKDASAATTDSDRAHQMLANLVENALRVTPEGGLVCVSVDALSVAVADSGPGLERDDVEHAFERFYLWRKYKGERPVGTGLGLAIVGELSQLLGVVVEIESSPASGTRVRLRFPGAGLGAIAVRDGRA